MYTFLLGREVILHHVADHTAHRSTLQHMRNTATRPNTPRTEFNHILLKLLINTLIQSSMHGSGLGVQILSFAPLPLPLRLPLVRPLPLLLPLPLHSPRYLPSPTLSPSQSLTRSLTVL